MINILEYSLLLVLIMKYSEIDGFFFVKYDSFESNSSINQSINQSSENR